MRKFLQSISILFILALGFYVRFVNYSVWPREGATFDEYAWPWLGMSLIQQGVPSSWSPHSQYENYEAIIYRKAPFRIVKPYLEHPPLFGLISGGYALLSGAKNMFDSAYINPKSLRKLSLFFGTTSILLIYLFVQKIYNRKMAVISSLLYATVPTTAVGSRLLQNENFMIPVWLFVLWMLAIYLESKKRIHLWLVSTVSALMIWAKIPWFVIGASVCAILIYNKRWKDCLPVGLLMVFSLFLFFLYGYFWDLELFANLWKLQLARYDIGLNSVLTLFTMPFLTDRLLVDGWIYFGWISISLLASSFKKHIFVLIPFTSYFLLYVWAIPGQQAQGWYRFPLYPFLIIAVAIVIFELFKKPALLAVIFQFIVGASAFRNGYEPIFGITFSFFRFLIIAWSIPAMLFLFFGKRFATFYRYSLFFWIFVFLILNVSSSRLYNEQ